jgi:hypothetical protein
LPNSEAVGNIADASLAAINLDYLMANSGDLTQVASGSIIAKMIHRNGEAGFVGSDDSLQGISEGAAGGGATPAQVQSACFDVIQDMNLDHFMKTPVANSSDLTAEIPDYTALSLIMAAGGDTSAFVSSDDSLQGISEGAAGGGASVAEVQSACFQVVEDMNLDHLAKTPVANSSDLTAEVADFTVLGLALAAGGNVSAFVSSDDSLQAISEGGGGGGATPAQVQSACYDAMNDHNVINVGSVDAQLDTLPTSQTLNTHIVTLPTSAELNAHILTLPLSAHVSDVAIALSSVDVEVGSINVEIDSLDARFDTVDASLATLPSSQVLNAHIITLPTSQTLDAHFLTMPTSALISGLNDPTVAEIADGVWDEVLTPATHDVGYSAGQRLRYLILTGNTAQAGGASTITLAAAESAQSNIFNQNIISLVAGTGAGQTRLIAEYDGTTKIATVDRAWDVQPIAGTVYEILPFSSILLAEHGKAAAGAVGSITLNTLASAVDDTYVGDSVFLSSGTGAGQIRVITAYDGGTKVATISPNWTTTPDNTSIYKILPVGRAIVDSNNDKTGYSLSAAGVGDVFTFEVDSDSAGPITFNEKLRLDLAVLTGISSGGGSNTLLFRDVADTKSRLVVTVDSDGNRSAVGTRDGS